MDSVKSINEIINDFKRGNFEITLHAFERMLERDISLDKIIEYADTLEIIEDYAEDKRSHSCLLLGFLKTKPIHVQTTRKKNMIMKIITVYEPDNKQWNPDFKRRKK